MIYKIENEYLKVEVNDLGAELWSVFNKESDTELLWQGDPAVWERRSPTLFPVCGSTHDPKMPHHGFIRDYTHTLEEQSDTLLVFKCSENDETMAIYPYQFSFYSVFTLDGNVLNHTYKVINNSHDILPFSVGYHSGFFADDSSVLEFQTAEICPNVMQTEDGFCSGKLGNKVVGQKQLALNSDYFPNSIILKDHVSTSMTLVTGGKPTVKLDFVGFPFVTMWVKEFPVKFICVEPWHGTPDPAEPYPKFIHKPNLVHLSCNETFSCTQSITAL